MSPRAAARLESMGFEQVYDYVAGKADWGSAGLPLEGTLGPRAGELARRDLPACRLDDRLQDVRRSVASQDLDQCLVVDDENVVLGRLGRSALAREDDVLVVEAMSEGPATVRPSITTEDLLERMRRRNLTSYVVTTSDGRLVGLVLRADLER
jgi:Mg/Co/Ni transporter MgtE